MDQQGSTPDKIAGGQTPSLPNSADVLGANAQPSQPTAPVPAQNGDLMGNLQQKIDSGEPNTGSSADTTLSQPTTHDTPTPQSEPQNQAQPSAGDSVEDNIEKWAASQNIDLNNPTPEQTRKLAQRLRDTQKWAHQSRTEDTRQTANKQFSDIQSQLADEYEDPVERELRELKQRESRRDFWDSNPEDRALEADMTAHVLEMIESGNKAGAMYYSTPQGWGDLLAIIKAKQSQSPVANEQYEAGRQVERANLAKVQQAAAPVAAAVSSAPSAPVDEESQIAKMTQAEYNDWRKTHNPFAVR